MPRYFFHLRSADDVIYDDEGLEMQAEAVHGVAVMSARSIIAADIYDGVLNLRGQIEVEDEQRTQVATLRFKDAVRSVG